MSTVSARTARIGSDQVLPIALTGEEDAFYLEAIEKLSGKIPVVWAEDEDFENDFKRPPKRPHSSSRTPERGKSDAARGTGAAARTHPKENRSRPTDAKDKPKKHHPGSDERFRTRK